MSRWLPVLASLAVLGVLYARMDLAALGAALRGARPELLAAALALELGLTIASAWRFARLAPARVRVGFGESCQLAFAGAALNVVLPLKLGEASKGLALAARGRCGLADGLAVGVLEKAWGLLALLTWCAAGLALAPLPAAVGPALIAGVASAWLGTAALLLGAGPLVAAIASPAARLRPLLAAWAGVCADLRAEPRRLAGIAALSLGLWAGYLCELWLLLGALGAWVPVGPHLALAALSLLAGMLPLTFLGIGARDAAIVVLYAPYVAAPTAAAFAVLCTARYLACALVGLPFLAAWAGGLRGTGRSAEPVEMALAAQE